MEDRFEKVIKSATKEAGLFVLEKYKKVDVLYTKKDEMDYVTEADEYANTMLVNRIKKEFPDHGIISEEKDEDLLGREYTWLIDPIDGTGNFSRGLPLFCVMITLLHKKTPILATIYHPLLDEFYFAKKGEGAYLNDHRIKCSKKDGFAGSQGDLPGTFRNRNAQIHERFFAVKDKYMYKFNSFRSVGVSSSFVAGGKIHWSISKGAKIWDYAPAKLLVEEAGGVALDFC